MPSLGTLAAELKIDGGSAAVASLRNVGGAVSQLRGLMGSLQGPLALLGVSLAAFKSAQGFTESLKGVFESARELQTLSRATGESVGNLKMLGTAFSRAGLDAGELPATLRSMQNALGGVNDEGMPTNDTLHRLGLNVQQLKTQSATQQLLAMKVAFEKIPDAASKAAAARAIFAREGQSVLALLNDPEALAGLGKGLSLQAQIFQKNAATFSRIAADLGMLSGKVRGFFVGFADQVGPPLLRLLDGIKGIDLTRIGQQAGALVATLASAFKSGQVTELLSLSLKIGAEEGANALWRLTSASVAGLGTLLAADLGTAAGALSEVLDANNWAGIGHALIAAGLGLESKLLDAADYLHAGLDYAFLSAAYELTTALAAPLKFFESNWAKAILNPLGTLTEVLGKAALGFSTAMTDALNGNLFGAASAAKGVLDLSTLLDPGKLTSDFTDALLKSGVGVKPIFGDILAGYQKQSAPDRANIDATATSERQAAGAILLPALTKKGEELAANFQKAAEVVKAALSAPGILDASGDKRQFSTLVESLKPSGGNWWSNLTKTLSANAGQMTGLAGNGKIQEGDRLARIGLFVGNGGPALDFNRRTAAATEKSVSLLTAIKQSLAERVGSRHLVPTWGS